MVSMAASPLLTDDISNIGLNAFGPARGSRLIFDPETPRRWRLKVTSCPIAVTGLIIENSIRNKKGMMRSNNFLVIISSY
jgi:hypothetical protein